MYKCCCCGELFEIPKAVNESRGEFWGMPAFETMSILLAVRNTLKRYIVTKME